MKVVAFNGSPRKDGNTTILINHVFRELEKGASRQNSCSFLERRSMDVLRATNVSRIKISGVL